MQPGPLVPDPPTPSLGCEPRAIPVHVHVLVSHRHETLTFSHCRPSRWDCWEEWAASCLRRSCERATGDAEVWAAGRELGSRAMNVNGRGQV